MKVNNAPDRITTVLFIVYLIALFWILLFKLGVRFFYMESRTVNLIPFNKPLVLNGKPDFGEIILNVLIFVPLGIYAGVLFKRWPFTKKVFFFFLISLMFEALQYILKIGAFDITDIITNTSGGIMGLLLFAAVEKIFNDHNKAQKIINIVATIGTIVIISLLVLLRMNLLPVRYQ